MGHKEVENENPKENQCCKDGFSPPSCLPSETSFVTGEAGTLLSAPLKASVLCTQCAHLHQCCSAFGAGVVCCGPKEVREKCPINFEPCSQCFSLLQSDLKSFLQRVLVTDRKDTFPLPAFTAEQVL